MRAALHVQPGNPLLLVDDVDLEAPYPGEVVVRTSHCGVCHSDLSLIDAPNGAVPTPIIAGHEATGVVEDVGDGVTNVAPGDRVVLTMRPPCHACYWCTNGHPVLCARSAAAGSGTFNDGTTRLSRGGDIVYRGFRLAAFAERVVVDAMGVVPLPESLPSSVAATIGCAVQTGLGAVLNLANVSAGDSVVVIGLGAVGLSAVQGARIASATTIVAVDPVASRRDVASRVGATHVLDPSEGPIIAAIGDLTGGRGADHVFDVVGSSDTVATAAAATRRGGGMVLIGLGPQGISLPIDQFSFAVSQKTLRGCFLGDCVPQRDFPRIFDLWRTGQLDLDSLATAVRPFAEINEAIDDVRSSRGVRTILDFGA